MNREIFNDLRQVMEEKVEDAHLTYGCDFRNHCFNNDYFVETEAGAEECIESWGVNIFKLINYNIKTEQEEFGEVHWVKENTEEKMNAQHQIKLAVYWLGSEMMYGPINDALESCWDNEMNLWDIKRVQEAIKGLTYEDVI